MKLIYLFSFCILFVFGCGITGPDIIEDLRLKTDKKEYLVGDTVVTLTVENRSDYTRTFVAISTCTIGLQQQINSHWKTIPRTPDLLDFCSSIRIGTIDLAPGAVYTRQLMLEEYEDVLTEPIAVLRLVLHRVLAVLKENSNIELVFSNTFTIVDTSHNYQR